MTVAAVKRCPFCGAGRIFTHQSGRDSYWCDACNVEWSPAFLALLVMRLVFWAAI